MFPSLSVIFPLVYGQSEMTKLTGEIGKRLCLITGLIGYDQVLLSCGSQVLLNYDNKEMLRESERFQLRNGSVCISPLNLTDSRVYDLRVYCGKNIEKHTYEVNVTRKYFSLFYNCSLLLNMYVKPDVQYLYSYTTHIK